MILTPTEIEKLTGRTRSDAQRRELEHLAIPHKVRRDGSLLVLWCDVEAQPGAHNHKPREPEMYA